MKTQSNVETTTPLLDAAKAWDFVIGRWQIVNKRLVTRLKGSTEWETFESTTEANFLPGGIVGNMDVYKPINWRPEIGRAHV